MTATLPSGIGPGSLLDEKFRIEELIGAGGMGCVYRAVNCKLGAKVAIKVLHEDLQLDPDAKERFTQEARSASKINSEHVAKTWDVGELSGGRPYMVIEFLEGVNLSKRVTQLKGLNVVDAVSYLLQACEGVAAAHALGIIHRDIKPENLFIARRQGHTECIKVLDFGVSKVNSADGLRTRPGTVMGSVGYMAPEQLHDAEKVDQRSDVWSLGATLFTLLTGEPPFPSKLQDFANAVLAPAPSLRMTCPELDEKLDAVVRRCLQTHPDQRYQNVAQLAWALVPFGPADSEQAARRVAETLPNPEIGVLAPTLPVYLLDQSTPRPTEAGPNSPTLPFRSPAVGPSRIRTGWPVVVAAVLLAIVPALAVLPWESGQQPQHTGDEEPTRVPTPVVTAHRKPTVSARPAPAPEGTAQSPPIAPNTPEGAPRVTQVATANPTKAGGRTSPQRTARNGLPKAASVEAQPSSTFGEASTRAPLPGRDPPEAGQSRPGGAVPVGGTLSSASGKVSTNASRPTEKTPESRKPSGTKSSDRPVSSPSRVPVVPDFGGRR